jgi:hypothetical protein
MPKGIKQTSDIVAISTSVTETLPNTLTSHTIELALSPLDNQVFVITKIDMDLQNPDLLPGIATGNDVTISSRSRTTVGSLADNDVVAIARRSIEGAAGLTTSVFSSEEAPDQAAPAGMDYLFVVFTNDLFLNILGTNNANPLTCQARIWGYRATASASVYAAGVQAELLG